MALLVYLKMNFPAFLGELVVKNLPANAGDARDVGLIPGSGSSPGEGNGTHFSILYQIKLQPGSTPVIQASYPFKV